MIVTQLGRSTFLAVRVVMFSRGSVVAEFDTFFTDEFSDDASGLRTDIVNEVVGNAYYANDTLSSTPTSLKLIENEDDITVEGKPSSGK